MNAAFQHFWANDVTADLQGQYVRVLTAVARHFANNPDVLGYELFNEPFGSLTPTGGFDRQLQCFYSGTNYAPVSCAAAAGPSQAPPIGAIPAVLAADTQHLVFYEAPVLTDFGFPETVGIAEPLPFDRLVLSFHDYGGTPGGSTFNCEQSPCSPQESHAMSLFARCERAATRTSQSGGPAWLLSEFGAETYVPDIANVTQLADANLLSWIYWAGLQLHDPTGGPGEGLLDQASRRPDPTRTTVLARAYPLATAGVPLSQSFNSSTGAFDFAYRADPSVHAPTEIVVPTPYHYPYGYTAVVRGARITSAHDAPLLTLVNERNASTVTVTLRALAKPGSSSRVSRRRHRHRSSRGRRARLGFTG